MGQNDKKIRKITLLSHLLVVCFLIFFLNFAEGGPYIYDKAGTKNTASMVFDILFAVLLIIHFVLLIVNILFLIQKITNKDLNLIDLAWSLYSLILILIISGFDMSNLLHFIKVPFNIIGSYISF